jgi:hypothetical protein
MCLEPAAVLVHSYRNYSAPTARSAALNNPPCDAQGALTIDYTTPSRSNGSEPQGCSCQVAQVELRHPIYHSRASYGVVFPFPTPKNKQYRLLSRRE